MMLYLLDIILLANLVYAYYTFKYLISPPVLMGAGMLFSSLIATLNYQNWNMDKMLFDSVLILGLGTVLFTIFCRLFKKGEIENGKKLQIFNLKKINLDRLKVIVLIGIIIGIISCILKYYYLSTYYGRLLSFSELIGTAHVDSFNEGYENIYPKFLQWIGTINIMLSYFVSWFFSIIIVKKIKFRFLHLLMSVYLSICIIEGFIGGTKASMLDPLFRFFFMYLFVMYAYRGSYKLPSFAKKFIIVFGTIILSGFKISSDLMGRDVEDFESIELLSVYSGAQIKNFDTFMKSKIKIQKSTIWGEQTFFRLYRDFGYTKVKYAGTFQDRLGNVYTQFYSFYIDWGIGGVVFMDLVISLLSMFVYNKAWESFSSQKYFNIYVFLYSTIALSLFMSFYSSRFTELVFRIQFVKYIIYILIFSWLLTSILTKQRRLTYKNTEIYSKIKL